MSIGTQLETIPEATTGVNVIRIANMRYQDDGENIPTQGTIYTDDEMMSNSYSFLPIV